MAGDTAENDLDTAQGFADYFRTIGEESLHTPQQFLDYFAPLDPREFRGKEVMELGFGHGSFLYHWGQAGLARLSGVDLGDSVEVVQQKLSRLPVEVELHRGDLVTADLGEHDLAYCSGVLHHLKEPESGFEAVLRHVKPGGRFHCWVYSREGNALATYAVDPIRRLNARLPRWAVKWVSGLFLAAPLFVYSRLLRLLAGGDAERLPGFLPLSGYCPKIWDRDFGFIHFLATDFLVARHTVFFERARVEALLRHAQVEPGSTYLIHHRGVAWKFGGRKSPG